jgi:hypothetical protein
MSEDPHGPRPYSGKTAPRALPSRATLLELLVIDPDSPSGLSWTAAAKPRRRRRAGSRDRAGYWVVGFGKRRLQAHRIVYVLAHGGDLEGREVDHVDGNPSNNAVANLRACNRVGNACNRAVPRGGSSAHKGVSRDGSRWRAYIWLGSQVQLGRFVNEADAAVAYNRAAFAAWGRFSRLNDLANPGETIAAKEINTDEMRARVGLPLEGEQ